MVRFSVFNFMVTIFLAIFTMTFTKLSLADEPKVDDKPANIKVLNFQIYDPIEDETQAETFCAKMKELGSKSDRIIVLTMDTPGGNIRLVGKMYEALKNYPGKKIAFIDNGRYGGVYGWPCVLPMICDEIIVHPKSSLGSKCRNTPLPVEQCKAFPCSDVYPKMQDYWMAGIDLTPDDEGATETVETFAMIAEKRTKGDKEVTKVFAVKKAETKSKNSTVNRSKNTEGSDDGQFVLASATMDEKGMAEVAADVRPAIETLADGKEIIETKIPLKSNLNRVILLLNQQLNALSDTSRISSLYDDSAPRRISFWNRKKAAAKSVQKIIANYPDLQYLLYDDIRSKLDKTPVPISYGAAYDSFDYNGSYDIRDWAVKMIDAIILRYDVAVSDMKDHMRAERAAKKAAQNHEDGSSKRSRKVIQVH